MGEKKKGSEKKPKNREGFGEDKKEVMEKKERNEKET